MNKVLKDFKLKGSLRNIKTREFGGVKEIIIQGYCGSDAVYKYIDKLKKEGIYELDESYSYYEIGPSKVQPE